jgi:hypothetical protein
MLNYKKRMMSNMALKRKQRLKSTPPLKPIVDVASKNGDETKRTVKPNDAFVSSLSSELQGLQRQRAVYIKSRIMMENRLKAIVAGSIGYRSGLEEKERDAMFLKAGALIKAVVKGKTEGIDDLVVVMVKTHMIGIEGFRKQQKLIEDQMAERCEKLPITKWINQPEQRGFSAGASGLGVLIGETGDLSNYSSPGKLWKRMGCAPFTNHEGVTKQGATWRKGKEGKLESDEWEKFGYSPRRRSISYLIGENLVKQNFIAGEENCETDEPAASNEVLTNGDACHETEGGIANGDGESSEKTVETESAFAGPYRSRYLEARRRVFETHPDWEGWRPCTPAKGKCKGKKCQVCGGTGQTCKRAQLHGMLLATKLFLKNLWIEWNK